MFGKIQSAVNAPPSSGAESSAIDVEDAGDAPPAGLARGASVNADLASMWTCLMRLCVLHANGRLDRGCTHFAGLYILSAAVCEAADADGCGSAADVACSLCFVLDRTAQPDKRTLAAIEEHIGMLEKMFHDGCWQDNQWDANELAGRLAEMRTAAGVAGIAEPAHGMGGSEGK